MIKMVQLTKRVSRVKPKNISENDSRTQSYKTFFGINILSFHVSQFFPQHRDKYNLSKKWPNLQTMCVKIFYEFDPLSELMNLELFFRGLHYKTTVSQCVCHSSLYSDSIMLISEQRPEGSGSPSFLVPKQSRFCAHNFRCF